LIEAYGLKYLKSDIDKVVFDSTTKAWRVEEEDKFKVYPLSIFGKERAKWLAFK